MQLALVPVQATGEGFAVDPTFAIAFIVVTTTVLVLVSTGTGYWVYEDASGRENDELLWAIAVAGLFFTTFVFGIVTLVAYGIVRGDETSTESTQDGTVNGEW